MEGWQTGINTILHNFLLRISIYSVSTDSLNISISSLTLNFRLCEYMCIYSLFFDFFIFYAMRSNLVFLEGSSYLLFCHTRSLYNTQATFKKARISFNLSIFLLKLLILRWQIKKAFSFNCLENILKFVGKEWEFNFNEVYHWNNFCQDHSCPMVQLKNLVFLSSKFAFLFELSTFIYLFIFC